MRVEGETAPSRLRRLLALIAVAAAWVGASSNAVTAATSPPPSDQPVGQCPSTGPDRGTFPFAAGPASTMAPDLPVSASVCRYGGLNPLDGYRRLQASGVVSDGQLQQLVTDLNAVGDNMRPSVLACPYDDGQTDLIIFNYQDAPAIYITVALLGCGIATNGAMRSMLHGFPDSPGEGALSLLGSLVGPPSVTH